MPKRRATSSGSSTRARSAVLLLGAGSGEATCGILYLAGYLRRHGLEAYVRLYDDDVTRAEIRRSLEGLLARVRPRMVGISLKWFHHLARALWIAEELKRIDPEVEVVVGGNTASYYWRELADEPNVDVVALGDGELPMLALARGDENPPNVVRRRANGSATRLPLEYVQSTAKSDDVFYSHFDEVFLSGLDLASFSGWVAPGKGCAENCLYCGGTRGVQQASFGRAVPYLRPFESVEKDHREIAPKTWQMRYDFSGSSAAFLEKAWGDVDLSRHATTYFLWGVPPPELLESLAHRFERVFMVLDIGCFSEEQRLKQIKLGLLKPCPTDAELMKIIERAQRQHNLELEISGIAGLPFASPHTLKQERALVEKVLKLGCTIGYQRLESQPGALVTEHPQRFSMRSEATTYAEFKTYFETLDPEAGTVPMVRYADPKLESQVQRTTDELETLIREKAAERRHVALTPKTRLENAAVSTVQTTLGDWLGSHKVPSNVRAAPVTVMRSSDGNGLACVPSVKRFSDHTLSLGDEGAVLLEVLGAFSTPIALDAAVGKLRTRAGLDAETSHAAIEHLVAGRFLKAL